MDHFSGGRPSDISRRIVHGEIITETFLQDLNAFLVKVDSLADQETIFAWRGHEHDPTCGYAVPVRSERAVALQSICDEMVDLATAIAAALDAARAYSIAK